MQRLADRGTSTLLSPLLAQQQLTLTCCPLLKLDVRADVVKRDLSEMDAAQLMVSGNAMGEGLVMKSTLVSAWRS